MHDLVRRPIREEIIIAVGGCGVGIGEVLFLTMGLDGFWVKTSYTNFCLLFLVAIGPPWEGRYALYRIIHCTLRTVRARVGWCTFVKLEHRYLNEALREMNTSITSARTLSCMYLVWCDRTKE